MKTPRIKRILIEIGKFFILISIPLILLIKKINNLFFKNIDIENDANDKNVIENWGIDYSDSKKNCVVLCNGPSLNKSLEEDYEFISDSVKIVVNFSPLSDIFWKFKPEFLVLVDPAFWQEDIDNELKNKIINMVEKIKDVDWDFKIVMPKYAKQKNNFNYLTTINKKINIIFINSESPISKSIEERLKEYMLNSASPLFQSVSVASLYFAINIGFKKIFLFGFDHDWIKNMIVDENNNVLLKDVHYYDKSQPQYKVIKSNLLEEFRAQYQLHNSYNELKEYGKKLNIEIYNCSENSLLDSFERIKATK